MPTHEEVLGELKRLAQIHVDTSKRIAGLDFDYSAASMNLLDPMIESSWGANPPTQLDAIVQIFGAYLGEVLVRTLDGRWAEKDGRWVVEISLPNGDTAQANVFYKVQKRFENGMEDSLGYYYAVMKKVHEEGMPAV